MRCTWKVNKTMLKVMLILKNNQATTRYNSVAALIQSSNFRLKFGFSAQMSNSNISKWNNEKIKI